ncbi:MAG: metallophosphoesterase [Calditrichaeota bacterium]|nr:MAG: metallophosphoesterase [Calditrichota bacterium]MBL1204787.1 metallophosphoesterase [Calditrichota bacterium]NOG44616.1 metallophosphoesterase [Calditrichota bacterium]
MFFITVLTLLIFAAFFDRWLLTKTNQKIWNSKIVQISAKVLPFAFVLFAPLWGLGTWQQIMWMRNIGATGTSISLILNVTLLFSLPIAFGVAKIGEWLSHKKSKTNTEVDTSRRLFLKTAVASIPIIDLSLVGNGLASSFSQTQFPQVSMEYPNLPDALEGFKILHLSDLHLGYYFGLEHLEQTLLDAEKYQPHMVVVTGDIADDLSVLPGALNLIDQFKTPFPKFAAVGNHEHFRGIREVIRKMNAGPVPLLLNQHHTFNVYNTQFTIGGVDDPVTMRSDITGFLDRAIDKTFKDASETDFKLLMSHRPRALDLAPKYGVDLTLSGHTHAGQVGLGGRSFWDIFNENGYLWGSYQKENCRLYTSAGMGHWFPFRLNCPLEAPIITLKKEPRNIS